MKMIWTEINCQLVFLGSPFKCECFLALTHLLFLVIYMPVATSQPSLQGFHLLQNLHGLSDQGSLDLSSSSAFYSHDSLIHWGLLLRLLASHSSYMLTTHRFLSSGPMPFLYSKCLSICLDHAICLSNKYMKFNIHQLNCLLTSLPHSKKPNKNCCSFSVHQLEQTLDVAVILIPFYLSQPSHQVISSMLGTHPEFAKRHTTSVATSLVQAPPFLSQSPCALVPLSLWFPCLLFFTSLSVLHTAAKIPLKM